MATILVWVRLYALEPSHTITQYAHSTWNQRAGMQGLILALTQTADGNLWIGSEFGLLRFDGVHFRTWYPPAGGQLLGESVAALMPGHDGSLWMGTKEGLTHWRNDRVETYRTSRGPAGPGVAAILEDREGVVWVGTAGQRYGGLCRVEKSTLRCYGTADGLPSSGVTSLFQDREGALWVGGPGGVCKWPPGEHRVYPLNGPQVAIYSIAQDKHGVNWMSTGGINGLLKFADGKLAPYTPGLGDAAIQPGALLSDRDGGLWIGTFGQGILHLAQGRIDRFTHADGLSNDIVRCLFEDKEGNIWAGTDGGLDQFRQYAVTTISKTEGLSDNLVSSVFATEDGDVWVGTNHGLNRIEKGKITTNPLKGLPSQSIVSIFQEQSGRLWVDSAGGLAYSGQDQFHELSQPLARNLRSIVAAAEDRGHSVWLSDTAQGLARLRDGRVAEIIPWSEFQNRQAWALEGGVKGGLWLGFSHGGVAYYKPGHSTQWYDTAEGLAPGAVTDLHFTRDESLWIATQHGLSRLQNGHIATLGMANGLPCDRIHAMVEDDSGTLWLNTACGLIRIAAEDLAAWSAKPQGQVQVKVFGPIDGMRTHPTHSGYFRRAAKSKDGRLWFVVMEGIAVVDPKHLPENHLAPPVQIEQITGDGKPYTTKLAPKLPPLTKDLQIDYTGLSLTVPEKVRFRYRLEGFDAAWQDVADRREAHYTNLPPKHYRFHVVACNNDGVWNLTGASVDFSIPPAFYQTTWFGVLMAAVSGTLMWMLYRLRVRQVAKRLGVRYEERLAERTRIARELHDTLLQNISGFALQLDGLAKTVTAPLPAKDRLRDLRRQAEQWLHEARESVWNLRQPISEAQDLPAALRQMGQQITAGHNVQIHVTVVGTRRAAPRKVQEHLLRIAQEACRNAIHHGGATEVRIYIDYLERKSIRIKISDDGCGFDLEQASRKMGHWGLATMRERSQQIDGELKISSAPGRGTEIEIVVPIKSVQE